MGRRGPFLLSWYGIIWAALALALWAAGAMGAAQRYDTATPHARPYNRYKYIPLRSNYGSYSPATTTSPPEPEEPTSSGMAPSQFILTALRTALDVVRNINANKKRANGNAAPTPSKNSAVSPRSGGSVANDTVSGRGMDYYDEHDHYHETTTTTAKPMKQGRYTDPWAGYYDWIINEGSFKFWSVFQLFTAALLLYACLSAIYYAKFNPIIPDYDREYDDYFLERTVGRQARSLDPSELASGLSWINPRTFQFILDAIANHYKEALEVYDRNLNFENPTDECPETQMDLADDQFFRDANSNTIINAYLSTQTQSYFFRLNKKTDDG